MRHPGIHKKIRAALREMPEGENVPALAKLLGHRVEAVRKALNAMPDA